MSSSFLPGKTVPENMSRKDLFFLLLIVLAALLLRFYKLDYQSLWLDELHTVKEADPSLSWKETIDQVFAHDFNPPLYFLLEKLMFTLFGFTEGVARCLSALAGVLGVIAIYFLGKELVDRRAGYIAAVFTAVNPFHIAYSQEARVYIFLFLFTVLSFLFFIRFVKTVSFKNAVWYGVNSLVMLHFNVYGMLAIIAQCIIGLVFFVEEKEHKWKFLKLFLLSGLIVIIGYLPILSRYWELSQMTSTWIGFPAPDFFVTFFYEYFGNAALLKPVLFTCLILYIVYVARSGQDTEKNGFPASFGFLVLITWLIVAFFLPYVYSFIRMPILITRYTIGVVPCIILLMAIGVGKIPSGYVRNTLVSLFVIISLFDLFEVKKYYTEISKTQYREMSAFIKTEDSIYPVINDRSPWQQSYYLEILNIKNPLRAVDKNNFIDSLTRFPDSFKDLKGFWLAGAHIEPKPSEEKLRSLDSMYIVAGSRNFFDAWAQLYIPFRRPGQYYKKLDQHDFARENKDNIDGDTVMTFWVDGIAQSTAFPLTAGNYKIHTVSRGTQYDGVYPHLQFFINKKRVAVYNTRQEYSLFTSGFSVPADTVVTLSIQMDNDGNDPVKKEDRNGFVKSIHLVKE